MNSMAKQFIFFQKLELSMRSLKVLTVENFEAWNIQRWTKFWVKV